MEKNHQSSWPSTMPTLQKRVAWSKTNFRKEISRDTETARNRTQIKKGRDKDIEKFRDQKEKDTATETERHR